MEIRSPLTMILTFQFPDGSLTALGSFIDLFPPICYNEGADGANLCPLSRPVFRHRAGIFCYYQNIFCIIAL